MFEKKNMSEHDVEIWSRRFEHKETYKHLQDSEDEQKRCLSTADQHEAKAIAPASLRDSEDDHERCLSCLSTAEVSKLRDISK